MVEHDKNGSLQESESQTAVVSDKPFSAIKTDTGWQLNINRSYFLSKGFTAAEIEGAYHLELERLKRQTGQDTQDGINGLRKWQNLAADNSRAVAFKSAFERISALRALEGNDPEKAALARRFLGKYTLRQGTNSADQLFNLILKKGLDHDVETSTGPASQVITNLGKTEEIEKREVSPIDALFNEDLSFSAKAAWFEARFLPRLEFLQQQDLQKEQNKEKEEQAQEPSESQEPPPPSPSQDEYEQHRGREEKGKGAPTFVIKPGITGYWEGESYDILDEQTGRLSKSDTQKIKTAIAAINGNFVTGSEKTIEGQSGTNLFSLPLVANFQPTQKGIDSAKSSDMDIFSDAEGHVFIKPTQNGSYNIEIAQSQDETQRGITSTDTEIQSADFPQEISNKLEEIRHSTTDGFERVALWQEFIQSTFHYPQDDQVENMYAQVDQSQSRIAKMAEIKFLDCYLARELFIGGLKRLDIPDMEWRSVNGFYAASKQKDNSVHLSSGNAHAWVKVRYQKDKEWTIFDPTPPGDPIHSGEQAQEEFAESSPELLSEDDIKEMEKEASEDGEKQSHKTQDEYLMQFAQDAQIPPEEARQILEVLRRVDELKDRQGRNILSRLREQFDRIIEYYTVQRKEFIGNVEMSRGFELDEPVATKIDVRSGSLDPTGFKRPRFIEEKEEYYGGLDLEIVADGSGSMEQSLGSKAKYLVQRDMSYLLHRALHRFSGEAQRRKLRLVTPLNIRSSQYMFRGGTRDQGEVTEIMPISETFTPSQMAILWRESANNVGGGTPAHLGLEAILDKITPEEVKLLQDKKLLKVVALISDGGYDDASKVNRLKNRLEDLNVIVAEFRINSQQSLEALPQNVAEKVIEAAKLLMPERIRR